MSNRSLDLLQLLVLLLATGGFLYLIYYAVRFGTRRIAEEQIRTSRNLSDEAMSTPDTYFREAEAMAARGDYRHALEKTYVGTLLYLGLHQALEFKPHRTNWENLRTLKRAFPTELSRTLRRVSRLFDRKWYGQEETAEREYRQAAEELAHIRAGVSALEPTPEAKGMTPAEVPA